MNRRGFTAGLAAVAAGVVVRGPTAASGAPSEERETIAALLAEIDAPLRSARQGALIQPEQPQDWWFLDDNGQIDAAFAGEGPFWTYRLESFIDLLTDYSDSKATYAAWNGPQPLPLGYVAYHALTRFAYIAYQDRAPADDEHAAAHVVFEPVADWLPRLQKRLEAAQQAWRALAAAGDDAAASIKLL